MELAAILCGLPILGCILQLAASKLLGRTGSIGLPGVLVLLMLVSLALALSNPTFEWGMRGAFLSIALIPVFLGSVATSFVLSRSSKLPEKDTGLNPTPD